MYEPKEVYTNKKCYFVQDPNNKSKMINENLNTNNELNLNIHQGNINNMNTNNKINIHKKTEFQKKPSIDKYVDNTYLKICDNQHLSIKTTVNNPKKKIPYIRYRNKSHEYKLGWWNFQDENTLCKNIDNYKKKIKKKYEEIRKEKNNNVFTYSNGDLNKYYLNEYFYIPRTNNNFFRSTKYLKKKTKPVSDFHKVNLKPLTGFLQSYKKSKKINAASKGLIKVSQYPYVVHDYKTLCNTYNKSKINLGCELDHAYISDIDTCNMNDTKGFFTSVKKINDNFNTSSKGIVFKNRNLLNLKKKNSNKKIKNVRIQAKTTIINEKELENKNDKDVKKISLQVYPYSKTQSNDVTETNKTVNTLSTYKTEKKTNKTKDSKDKVVHININKQKSNSEKNYYSSDSSNSLNSSNNSSSNVTDSYINSQNSYNSDEMSHYDSNDNSYYTTNSEILRNEKHHKNYININANKKNIKINANIDRKKMNNRYNSKNQNINYDKSHKNYNNYDSYSSNENQDNYVNSNYNPKTNQSINDSYKISSVYSSNESFIPDKYTKRRIVRRSFSDSSYNEKTVETLSIISDKYEKRKYINNERDIYRKSFGSNNIPEKTKNKIYNNKSNNFHKHFYIKNGNNRMFLNYDLNSNKIKHNFEEYDTNNSNSYSSDVKSYNSDVYNSNNINSNYDSFNDKEIYKSENQYDPDMEELYKKGNKYKSNNNSDSNFKNSKLNNLSKYDFDYLEKKYDDLDEAY